MSRLRKWTKRALFAGLTAGVVLIASAFPGSGDASPLKATAPSLGNAARFAVLGGSTVTNTGNTTITGDLGVSPGDAVTGFPPGIVNGGAIYKADAIASGAQSDATTAYNNLAGQALTADLTGQDLGGKTLSPGVYKFTSTAQLTGALTLDGGGDASAVWVFQIGSTLTTASNSSVSVINSGSACNVFWQVGSSATLGTTTTFVGNILALTSITLNNGASVSGRALARNGAVTLDTNNVSDIGCAPAPTATAVPPTATATAVPHTATATAVPPTATATAVPPTATATSAPTSAPAAASTDSGDNSPPPATQPVPTATPVPVSTPVPAVVLTPVTAAGVEIAPSTLIQVVALPEGTVLHPGQVALPIGALIVLPSVPELGPVLVDAPILVELADEVVVPAPLAVPRALPSAGDAGSHGYGWWMVAGVILSIAGFVFLRAGRRRL